MTKTFEHSRRHKMRVIDRLRQYLAHKQISAYKFEKSVNVANGYLSKQVKGKGSIGSDILIRIYSCFPELDIIWLLFGIGQMISDPAVRPSNIQGKENGNSEDIRFYLNDHFSLLEIALSHKEAVFQMLKGLGAK